LDEDDGDEEIGEDDVGTEESLSLALPHLYLHDLGVDTLCLECHTFDWGSLKN